MADTEESKKPQEVAAPAAPAAAQGQLIKKREQIASGSRKMFLWVAGGSVIISFSIVASIFIFKQLVFNEKLLVKKGETISTLKTNVESAKQLHKTVDALRADRNLTKARAPGSKNNLDVVLDALPYEGDTISLGSSLQQRLLDGIAVDSLSVDSVVAAEDLAAGTTGAAPASAASTPAAAPTTGTPATGVPAAPVISAEPITFTFKVTATPEELIVLLEKLDKSIRPIKFNTVEISAAGQGKLEMVVSATTYFLSKKTFELKETNVKP